MHFSAQKNEGGTFKARLGGLFDGPSRGYPSAMKMLYSLDTESIVMKLAKTPASVAPAGTKKPTLTTKKTPEIQTRNGVLAMEIAKKLDQVIDALENDHSTQAKILKHSRA